MRPIALGLTGLVYQIHVFHKRGKADFASLDGLASCKRALARCKGRTAILARDSDLSQFNRQDGGLTTACTPRYGRPNLRVQSFLKV